jgi:hypothetical protein
LCVCVWVGVWGVVCGGLVVFGGGWGGGGVGVGVRALA